MSIHLTQTAVEHFGSILKRNADAVGIRFGVKSSGCAQYRYVIDIAKAANAESDNIIDIAGIKLVVDKQSLPIIADTEIDYEKQGLNSMLVFRNPHAANACGCGESFTFQE
jgi:iron-sulfur cluster assembly protein